MDQTATPTLDGNRTDDGAAIPTIVLRTDAWEGARGGLRALLVYASGDGAEAVLVARSGPDGAWTVGRCIGGRDLLDADREAVEAALVMAVLRQEVLNSLGLLGKPNLRSLVWEIAIAALHLRSPADRASARPKPPAGRTKGHTVALAYRYGYKETYDRDAFRNLRSQAVGPLRPGTGVLETERRRTFTVNRKPTTAEALDGGLDAGRAGLHEPYDFGRVQPFLAPWYETIRSAVQIPWNDFSRLLPWSSQMHAYVSATGTVGVYRRQALALYPFLGPVFASEPSVLSLIDAGRPFEATLIPILDRWAGLPGNPGYSLAKLRRMRGIRMDDMSVNELCDLVRATARIGPPTLSKLTTRTGRARLCAIEEWVRRQELDGDVVFRDVPASVYADLLGDFPLNGVMDMVRRCAKTFVSPCISMAYDILLIPDHDLLAIHLLLEGLSLGQCLALERRWHENLGPFEARLPVPKVVVTWPALFEPYDLGDVRVSCLTTTEALRAEGAGGLDAGGERGLGHCIGGYGTRCYTGEVHVASVRVRKGRRWRRLSTVAFTVESGKVTVSQHAGRANAAPPPEALRAVEVLLSDIRLGAVATDPEAFHTRDAGGFQDGVDWSDPANMQATLSAWRPFLPAWAAEAGVMDAVARVDALQRRFPGYPDARNQG